MDNTDKRINLLRVKTILDYYDGYITESQACDILDDLDYITEKKTRSEYVKKKFLSKYKYDKNDGTIDIGDGERVKVNISDRKNEYKTIRTKDGKKKKSYSPFVGAKAGVDKTLTLDRPFFDVKNSKRRDAILGHEIGHIKQHFTPKNVTKDVVDSFVSGMDVDKIMKQYNFTRDEINNISANDLHRNYSELSKEMSDGNIDKTRHYKYSKIYPKYTLKHSKNNLHSTPHEIEADDYAIKRVGMKNFKKGLNDFSKKVFKLNNRVTKKMVDKFKSKGNIEKAISTKHNRDMLNNKANEELKLRLKFADDHGKNEHDIIKYNK